MTNDELLDLARALNERDQPYALVTVVRAIAPTSAFVGAQAIVLADGTLHGWIGGGCAQGVVVEAAQAAIAAGGPKLVRISNDRVHGEDDVEQHTMSCASNGTIELFVQPHSARSVLCVLGETPAAEEARFLAQRLGMRLASAPADVPVVLVATQGQGDEAALESALRGRARHVLMIASRRKAERLRALMRTRGIAEERLACLVAPAGPDAGAKAPNEIALVAIVAVLAALRGRLAAAAACAPAKVTLAAAPALASASAQAAAPQGMFVNPVCGIAVSMANPKHVVTHAGEAYYFCCDCCHKAFLKEPERYAAIHHASLAGATA